MHKLKSRVFIDEYSIVCILLAHVSIAQGAVSARTFTMVNRCSYTVWPAILPSSGQTLLAKGGFSLSPGAWYTVQAPYGWSGRVWPRTGCDFDATGKGSCVTGDCGNKLLCNGIGGRPPASLLEITLDGASGMDFYDVSLVDGFNIPVSLCPRGGSGSCKVAGCTTNLNINCPGELQMKNNYGETVACKSACLAFSSPEYCCTGGYANTCHATRYSQVFKSACPAAYSFAKDDLSSLYTCSAADYTVTFCPSKLAC